MFNSKVRRGKKISSPRRQKLKFIARHPVHSVRAAGKTFPQHYPATAAGLGVLGALATVGAIRIGVPWASTKVAKRVMQGIRGGRTAAGDAIDLSKVNSKRAQRLWNKSIPNRYSLDYEVVEKGKKYRLLNFEKFLN